MKKLLFLFSYIFTCSVFGQECRINNDPVSPLKDIACKSSVGYKDDIQFYSFPDSLNHLLISISVEDYDRRISYPGDSAIVLLKNKRKIKLTNIRNFVPRYRSENLILVDMDVYKFTIMAWISKEDVKQLSKHLIDNIRFHIQIEENFLALSDEKVKHKFKAYIDLSRLSHIPHEKIRGIAKCALNL